jgi:hypothetical protein
MSDNCHGSHRQLHAASRRFTLGVTVLKFEKEKETTPNGAFLAKRINQTPSVWPMAVPPAARENNVHLGHWFVARFVIKI